MVKRQYMFALSDQQIDLLDTERAHTGASRAEIVRRAINAYMRAKGAPSSWINEETLQDLAAGRLSIGREQTNAK